MRLQKVTISRFKGINEVTIQVPKTNPARPGSADFVSLVGRNNMSKSSVLEALRLALPTTDVPNPTLDHFPDRNPENGPIEVELTFDDLTNADQEEQGIRTHVHNGEYRVKKVWKEPGKKAPNIYAFQPAYTIAWPDPANKWVNFEQAGEEWQSALAQFDEQVGPRPPRMNKDVRAKLEGILVESGSPLVEAEDATWVENPGGFSSHVDSVLPHVLFVPAIRETGAEAHVAQKKSAARQIVESMFQLELALSSATSMGPPPRHDHGTT